MSRKPTLASSTSVARRQSVTTSSPRTSITTNTPSSPRTPRPIDTLVSLTETGSFAGVKELVEKGCDINGKARTGVTPLKAAIKSQKTTVVQLLLSRGARCEARDYPGELSPLAEAVTTGKLDVVQTLLDRKVKVNDLSDVSGSVSALMIACQHGCTDVAGALLAGGADVNYVSVADNSTCLHVAAHGGNVNLCLLLIEKSASLEATRANGATPLFLAACEGKPAALRVLISKGASVNTTTTSGLTPLMGAAFKGSQECCQVLLDARASLVAVNAEGSSAADCARAVDNEALATFLDTMQQQGKADQAQLEDDIVRSSEPSPAQARSPPMIKKQTLVQEVDEKPKSKGCVLL